ncbi:autotransporter-associated beta strand repeat-containing protein [Fontisphaera persica]|uniref:beta strand repeat-containing protein n=1 Tax=Fontisphaera persica TaxID=2974023 RepID=UPI0024BF1CE5|nr:autotransporter-associated beta strand repeat-containing protein [Fontisphaera persica]WCJ61181.1 autotransporter-associated beta strand repeat-containing protein [Fontisphaera persica]
METGTWGITNLDADVQVFNTQMRLVSGNQTWSSVAGGGLTFNNTVDLRGRILTLAGAGTLTFNGVVTENSTSSITHNSTGLTIFNGNNNYTGGLTINNGTVRFGHNNAAGTGTLTLNGGSIQAGGGARTLNNTVSVGGDFGVGGTNDLTLSGDMTLVSTTNRVVTVTNSGLTTFSGYITGSGLVKSGTGTLLLSNDYNDFDGLRVQAGTLSLRPGGNLDIYGSGSSVAGSGAIVIDGGTLLLNPVGDITTLDREITWTTNGGTLDIARPARGVSAWGGFNVNASSNTPAIIRYNTLANTVGYGAWDAGEDFNIPNGSLYGTGTVVFALDNGATFQLRDTNFLGTLILRGPANGNSTVGSFATNVGRLSLSGNTSPADFTNFAFYGGVVIEGAVQVTEYYDRRRISSDILVRTNARVNFQGRSTADSVQDDYLILGGSVLNANTLTIQSNAVATIDIRFRSDNAINTSGVILDAKTVIEAGGTLMFGYSRQNDGLPGMTGEHLVRGNIEGRGRGVGSCCGTEGESIVDLRIGIGSPSTNLLIGGFTNGVIFAPSVALIVNSPDPNCCNGLRIQGPGAFVTNLVTPARLQNLQGTNGTLTIAFSDSAAQTFAPGPSAPSPIKLGFDRTTNTVNPVYTIGQTANDMANFSGLVVKGGTVQLGANQSFVGTAAIRTTLDVCGGTLVLGSGTTPRTLTIEGNALLQGGTLSGGAGTTKGTLVIGGDLIGNGTTLANTPNITMNPAASETTYVSGTTPLTGMGAFVKNGPGTTVLANQITPTRVVINNGTLLLGADERIGNSVPMTLAGGTFATGGYDETLGKLTLDANSTVDLGAGNSILTFANSTTESWNASAILSIVNWTGNLYGGGTDQVHFGPGGLTAGQLSQVRFVNPFGLTPGIYNAVMLSSGEVVPVPEPATIVAVVLLAGLVGWRERNRWLVLGRKVLAAIH